MHLAHAQPIVALVQHMEDTWDWSEGQFPRASVSTNLFAVAGSVFAITVRKFPSYP